MLFKLSKIIKLITLWLDQIITLSSWNGLILNLLPYYIIALIVKFDII